MAGETVVGAATVVPMRVQLVDPRGDVTPYDHALSAALVRCGADVELVTSRFVYGPIPEVRGYALSELFYRRAVQRGLERRGSRRALRLLEHVPDMLRYRRHASGADVRHFEWLPLEALDTWLIPNDRPRVMTLHNVIRRGEGRGSAAVTRRLAERMDAVVVHTEHGRRRLHERLGVDPAKVRVIPHGAFDHLTHQREEAPLPDELARVEGPVVLSFGMVRPYKGVDVLLDAFRHVPGAELWVVGRPLDQSIMDTLRERTRDVPGTVRFVTRYVTETEIPAFFRRADLVVLPYRSVDQSGVLYIGLAFGKPMVISAVGGFQELGEQHGAARLVPPGRPEPLAAAVNELLADPDERARLGERAAAAAAGPYSWDNAAALTLDLYEELLA
jgi:glycosyltransferase involved in cell wall biosynthesis